jgi:hypothetical protein
MFEMIQLNQTATSTTRKPFQGLIKMPKDLYLAKALKQIQDLKLLSGDMTHTMRFEDNNSSNIQGDEEEETT